jgi:hypothetical protein
VYFLPIKILPFKKSIYLLQGMFPVATFAVALQNAWPLQEMTVSDAVCLPGPGTNTSA